jgi:CheY-like chemotaxis protein
MSTKSKIRILVVKDDATVRMTISKLLNTNCAGFLISSYLHELHRRKPEPAVYGKASCQT